MVKRETIMSEECLHTQICQNCPFKGPLRRDMENMTVKTAV